MAELGDVREGMTVRTADGRKVGLVVGVGDTHFELEKKLVPIPRRDYLIEYGDVDMVRGEEVFLKMADHPLLTLEVDDDGSNLPPRHSEAIDTEPTTEYGEAAQPH
jgi:hypothetical protein